MRAPSDHEAVVDSYARFIREQAHGRLGPVVAATLLGWDERLSRVRDGLMRSFGRMPERPVLWSRTCWGPCFATDTPSND